MATSSFGESRDWGNISLCWGTGCAVRAELNNGPYFKIWLSKLTAYGIAFIIQHECALSVFMIDICDYDLLDY